MLPAPGEVVRHLSGWCPGIARSRTGFIFLFLILVILSTGCTAADPPAAPTTPPPATQASPAGTVSPPGGTPAAQAAASPVIPLATTVADPVTLFGNYTWAEYRNNITQTLAPNPRYQWEMRERVVRARSSFGGKPATRYTVTETSDYSEWIGQSLVHTPGGFVCITERYYAADGTFLGGNQSVTLKGTARPVTPLPVTSAAPGDRPASEMGFTPFEDPGIPLAANGTVPVKVPAGSWQAAGEYVGTFRDGSPVAFRLVPGIPVPVQYIIHNRYLDGTDPVQSYELIAWG